MRKLLALLLLCSCSGARAVVPSAPNQVPLGLSAKHAKIYDLPTATDPTGITSGPDGALWFTEYLSSDIGRITTSGTITTYPTLTANASPFDIVTGPDNALWFTESTADKICRITTTGKITQYSVKYAPTSITVGPDGNLWFLEEHVTTWYVAKMTTAGKVTQYKLKPANSLSLNGITSGPDKAIWFTLEEPNIVGRITTSGHIKLFTNTDGDTLPSGIANINGSIWVGEASGVANVSTAGVFTEYPLKNPGDVLAITTGPNTAPWYGVSALGEVGTISKGKTKVYQAAPEADIRAIVLGRDHALWFTVNNESEIGRFSP
jgi:virginiamycin B lyase